MYSNNTQNHTGHYYMNSTNVDIPGNINQRRKSFLGDLYSLRTTTSKIFVAFVTLIIFVTFLNIYWLREMQTEHMKTHFGSSEHIKSPVLWVNAKNIGSGYLQHVFNVFERVGFVVGSQEAEWDVMWSHDYPFTKLQDVMQKLKPTQKVNKFPGSGFITNKVSLATSNIPFIPKAFRIPSQKAELRHYAQAHPKLMWVQKSNNHRGIRILPLDQLDLDADNTFVQQYIDDPFLIDGKRFDIGIYVVLTSIDPLRVYMYEGDYLFRYCLENYYPFDPESLGKYVVGDDYVPTWKMPSLRSLYTDKKYTHKQAFFHYLKQKNLDSDKLHHDIQSAIRNVYIEKEHHLIAAASRYPSKRSFFELVRFDFVLDKNLNIYLMEVNMSPNLSSKHFSQNKLLYEQVLFGMLSVVGLAKSVTSNLQYEVHNGRDSTLDEINMQVSDRDIQLDIEICSKSCEDNCAAPECKLCILCWNIEERSIYKSAYLEHMNRKTYNRLFPPRFSGKENAQEWMDLNEKRFNSLNPKNKLMLLWFREKCFQDVSWCS